MNLLWFLPVFVILYMGFWFLVSLLVERRDIIDIAWGAGFLFLAWITFSFRDLDLDARSVLLLSAVSLWGFRLSFHTVRRNLSKEEDWRYHRWSQGQACLHPVCVFFQVFLLQGALMMIISLPVVYGLRLIHLPLFELNYPGIVLIAFGLIFEAIADQQRYIFLRKTENQDKLITTGLWRFSRHPNYFGEMVFWWGIYFLVLGAPKSWMLIVSPLTITYILLFVSDLPMEERYRGRQDFAEYKRRTSALIPWFVKKSR